MISLEIVSGCGFLSDMRPGPSEDGRFLNLIAGEYNCSFTDISDFSRVYEVIKNGESFNREELIGELSTGMNLFGIFDHKKLLDEFSNFERLYEWGSSAIEDKWEDNISQIITPDKNKITCFPVGCMGSKHEIYGLYDNDRLIGCRIVVNEEALYQKSISVDGLYKFYIRFNRGEIELYASCDYDDESIADEIRDVVTDYLVGNVEERINQLFNNEEPEIDPDTPLGNLNSDLGHIEKFSIYSVTQDGQEKFIKQIDAVDSKSTLNGIFSIIHSYLYTH